MQILYFHALKVSFCEKHFSFWILWDAFFGTPGRLLGTIQCSTNKSIGTGIGIGKAVSVGMIQQLTTGISRN